MNLNRALSPLALVLMLGAPSSAHAHEDAVSTGMSVQAGFLHPITGLDHLTAMVAVGVLSAVIGGRWIVLLPATFVTALAVGGTFGFEAFELVGVEWWIVMSILALGAMIALDRTIAPTIAMAVVIAFGFAHGNAHGLELPVATSAAGYAAGFAAASALCHLAGVGIGSVARKFNGVRVLGLATSCIGVFLFSQLAFA